MSVKCEFELKELVAMYSAVQTAIMFGDGVGPVAQKDKAYVQLKAASDSLKKVLESEIGHEIPELPPMTKDEKEKLF